MEGRVPHVGYSKFPTVQINLPNLFFLQLLHTLLINDMKHTWDNHFHRLFHFLKTFFIYTNRYYLTFCYKYISKWLYKFESLIKLLILNLFKLYYSQRKLVEDRSMRRAMVVGDGFSNTSRKNQCA